MKPDVLFWFYKDFELCEHRLRSLRRQNPDVRIYGLYGGPLSDAAAARARLGLLLDDLYVFTEDRAPAWKWQHGDRLITAWYNDRGRSLDWATVFVMQWDLLVVDALERVFASLKPDEILLSGFRALDEVESWWPWARQAEKREELESFTSVLARRFDYHGPLFACLFIVACLPRSFLDRYARSDPPDTGFLEYKIPTFAAMFGVRVCTDHPHQPWWAADPAARRASPALRTLNAVGHEVPTSVILRELDRRDGRRIFHPVSRHVPDRILEHRRDRWLRHRLWWSELPRSILGMAGNPRLGWRLRRHLRFLAR